MTDKSGSKTVDSEEKIQSSENGELAFLNPGREVIASLEQYLTTNELDDDREFGQVFLEFLQPLESHNSDELSVISRLAIYFGNPLLLGGRKVIDDIGIILRAALEDPEENEEYKITLKYMFRVLARPDVYGRIIETKIWTFSDFEINKRISDTAWIVRHPDEDALSNGKIPLISESVSLIVETAGEHIVSEALQRGIISKAAMLRLVRTEPRTTAIEALIGKKGKYGVIPELCSNISESVVASFGRYVTSLSSEFQVNFYIKLQNVYDEYASLPLHQESARLRDYVRMVSRGFLTPELLYRILQSSYLGILVNHRLITLVLEGVLDSSFYRELLIILQATAPITKAERDLIIGTDQFTVMNGLIVNFRENGDMISDGRNNKFSPDPVENKNEIQNAVLQGRRAQVVNSTTIDEYKERQSRKRKGYKEYASSVEAESKSNTSSNANTRTHTSSPSPKLHSPTLAEDDLTTMFHLFFC